ncbi:MAG TPA: hypothetical protein VE734_05630, partial [Terriglobales bacterium]|nr:hypothetical protein [Terriglobales bacterium]
MLLAKSLYRLERQTRNPVATVRSLLGRRALGRVWQLKKTFPDSWPWILRAEHVQGFLSPGEADQLYRLARDFTPQERPV